MRAHQQSQEERIIELERELNRSKQKQAIGERAENVLSQMVEAGYVVQQEDGNYAPPEGR